MSYTLNQMMDILLAHLQLELAKDGTGEAICSFTKQPGDSVSLDYAECGGMGWVRFASGTPSVSGSSNDVTMDSCYWGLSHQIEMGVMRPAPIPDETFNTVELPSDAELSAAAEAQINDMSAMHRAIKAARAEFELLPGAYTPIGPVGGTVGGTWSLMVVEE